LDVYHTSTDYTWCVPGLQCAARVSLVMQDPKNRHLGTIAQLCRAISSQLWHVSTIGKIVKQQYFLHMFPQHGELQPTSGWDQSGSLGHLNKFQRVSRLGSVTARHFSSGRYCALAKLSALNKERHLYSTGRPSHWALAHILALRYFTEFVYDVVVKQLPRFQNLVLIVYDHIYTICAIIQRLFGQNKLW